MIYIVDLFIKEQNDFGEYDEASLTIYDGKDKIVLCGLRQPELVLISCSNIVEFNFSSTHKAIGYRGIKVYFQTIDAPHNWICSPMGFTTMTTTT